MNREKVSYLVLAIFATLCIAAIGVAIAERSWLIALFCFTGMYLTFVIAKKLRNHSTSEN